MNQRSTAGVGFLFCSLVIIGLVLAHTRLWLFGEFAEGNHIAQDLHEAGILLLGALPLALPGCDGPDSPGLPGQDYAADLQAAWEFVRDGYAYLDEKRTDWDRVRASLLPRAEAVEDNPEFIGLLEEVLEELYDHHAHLGVNTASSPRLVPSGTDLWAEYREGVPLVTDVRSRSGAEAAGLRPGVEVLTVNGRPIREAVTDRMPSALEAPDPEARDWALRAALAGRHDQAMEIEVRSDGGTKRVRFRPGLIDPPQGLLAAEMLGDGVGYIRIHDSLGDMDLIAAWDSTLVELSEARAIVLDLRETPSGGNSTVARGLLGRLVSEVRHYQRHELPAEERSFGVARLWTEYVAPRGPFTYQGPVVALVGRWTGSMGEGVAIGLDGMGRAVVVGTPMAGLRGALHTLTLPHTGIQVRIPGERLYHVDGTPREEFVPTVMVEPSPDPDADPAVEAALNLLR